MEALVIVVGVLLAIFVLPSIIGIIFTGVCAIIMWFVMLVIGIITAVVMVYSFTVMFTVEVFDLIIRQYRQTRNRKIF